MRQMLAKDIAPFTKILAKMELKDSIKKMFSYNNKKQGDMVSELIWGIIENYYKAEKDFFKFLADLQEEKTLPVQIENLPLPEFINLITELVSDKNLPFFKLAAK